MKTALLHDWLSASGGAEQCLKSFVRIWKDADVYSIFDDMSDEDRADILDGGRTHVSFIQKIPLHNKIYPYLLPLFPAAVSSFDLSGYDVIISGSHCMIKNVRTLPGQKHICYIYTPARYLWDMYDNYISYSGFGVVRRKLADTMARRLRAFDLNEARRPDSFVAISKYIAAKVKTIYGVEPCVIYPPVDTDLFIPQKRCDDYYVTVSRLAAQKNIDVMARAFAISGKRLVIIGDGPEKKKIEALAGTNTEMTGRLPAEDVRRIVGMARAFVFCSEEDFGIAPAEAQAGGVPVIALGRGGVTETVNGADEQTQITGEHTGIFFSELTTSGVNTAVERFERNEDRFDRGVIRRNALRFSRDRFENEIREHVRRILGEKQK